MGLKEDLERTTDKKIRMLKKDYKAMQLDFMATVSEDTNKVAVVIVVCSALETQLNLVKLILTISAMA